VMPAQYFRRGSAGARKGYAWKTPHMCDTLCFVRFPGRRLLEASPGEVARDGRFAKSWRRRERRKEKAVGA